MNIKIPIWARNFYVLLVISYATWIILFSAAGQMNIFLITCMIISSMQLPFLIKDANSAKIFASSTIVILLLFLFSYCNKGFRISTIGYTGLYIYSFTYLIIKTQTGILKTCNYLKFIKFLLYAHTFMIIIQQICLILGIEPINYTQGDTIGEQLRINGLAPEPSHIARFQLFFMLSYITLKKEIANRKYKVNELKGDKYVWLAFAWSMLSIGSTTGVIFFALVFLPLLSVRNSIIILSFTLIGYSFINYFDERSASRSVEFIEALLSGSVDLMMQADLSGASRIVPIILILQDINISNLNDYLLGHGIDSMQYFLAKKVWFGVDGFTGGGVFSFIYEYGILASSFLFHFIYTNCYLRNKKLLCITIFILLSIQPVNSQIFWLGLIILSLTKFHINKIKYEKSRNRFNSCHMHV